MLLTHVSHSAILYFLVCEVEIIAIVSLRACMVVDSGQPRFSSRAVSEFTLHTLPHTALRYVTHAGR